MDLWYAKPGPTHRARRFVHRALVVVALYIASYVVLSLCGAYSPVYYSSRRITDPSGLLGFRDTSLWEPAGMGLFSGFSGFALTTFYAPLLWLDRKWWHRPQLIW